MCMATLRFGQLKDFFFPIIQRAQGDNFTGRFFAVTTLVSGKRHLHYETTREKRQPSFFMRTTNPVRMLFSRRRGYFALPCAAHAIGYSDCSSGVWLGEHFLEKLLIDVQFDHLHVHCRSLPCNLAVRKSQIHWNEDSETFLENDWLIWPHQGTTINICGSSAISSWLPYEIVGLCYHVRYLSAVTEHVQIAPQRGPFWMRISGADILYRFPKCLVGSAPFASAVLRGELRNTWHFAAHIFPGDGLVSLL